MRKDPRKGTCSLCASTYTGKGISRHLSSCLSRHLLKQTPGEGEEARSFFHAFIKSRELPEYWLHVTIDSNSQLEDLDRFLRNIWLECCGHLSAFFHHGRLLDPAVQVCEILRPGLTLLYRYDFGNATDLIVRAVSLYEGGLNGHKPIHMLARNQTPEIRCAYCGKNPAVKVCTACRWTGRGWLCEECAETHPCGDEIIQPVVNSPRTGVCGYRGMTS